MARGYPDNWSPERARTEQYQTTISTPANTGEGSKKETSITLEEGIITYLRVLLPYGSVGLLHIQIYYGEDQIAPKGEGSYHGDGDSFISITLCRARLTSLQSKRGILMIRTSMKLTFFAIFR